MRLNHKPNILERIKAKKRGAVKAQARIVEAAVRAPRVPKNDNWPVLNNPPPQAYPADKGLYLGSCNRSGCLRPGANWWNHGSHAYYCRACAHWLNTDSFNRREAHKEWGHDLCTEGKHHAR